MAPVAGVTNTPFRIIVGESGCPQTFTEMVSSEALSRQVGKTRELLHTSDKESSQPFVQLFGSRPDAMATSARICVEEGFTLVDVNMGCPVKKVTKSGSGVQLMEQPKLAGDIVSAMHAAVGKYADITVKTRLGSVHGDERLIPLGEAVIAAGASMLTVHGRTRSDGFGGRADWRAIGQMCQGFKVPLVVNGDITCPTSLRRALKESGAQGAMIAREGYHRPWLFKQIAAELSGGVMSDPGRDAIVKLMLRHLELLELYCPDRAHVLMRKHGSWYTKGFSGGSAFRQQLNQCPDSHTVRQLLSAWRNEK
nr:tRNA-dihydrouridine synthase [Desulfurispira natronophila]